MTAADKHPLVVRPYEPKDKAAVDRLAYQLFMVDSVEQLRDVLLEPRNIAGLSAFVLPLSFAVRSIARQYTSSIVSTLCGAGAGGAGFGYVYMLPKFEMEKFYRRALDTDMKNIKESYVDRPRSGWFVAEDTSTNQVVGMLGVRPVELIPEALQDEGCIKDWDPKTTAQLQHVCLDPAYRGKGVGYAMWNEALKCVKSDKDYRRVMLYSSTATRNAVFNTYPRWSFKMKTQTRPKAVPFFLSNYWMWEMVTEDF